jgi:DNA adenine methylase Dam
MIVSCIPFTGNKRKLWEQISPHLPDGKVFVDMFTGGGTVALNVVDKYEYVVACDVIKPLIELHRSFQEGKTFIDKVTKISEYYPKTKEGYLSLREMYNIEPSPAKLQALLFRSNNNMMRFNSKGEMNMTYGERFSYNLERMQLHAEVCKKISFNSGGWERLFGRYSPIPTLPDTASYVFYSDCPYSGSTAVYNECGGWTDEDDVKLLDKLLELQQIGCHVLASNVFENRGKVNQRWVDFCKLHEDKFTVHHLDRCYNNSSFRKGKGKTDEVLIVSKQLS